MTCTSRDGTTDSTVAFPVKERLPRVIIRITKAVTVITLPAPFTQDSIIPVITILPVFPFGRDIMDIPAIVTSIDITITTPPGMAVTNIKGAGTGALGSPSEEADTSTKAEAVIEAGEAKVAIVKVKAEAVEVGVPGCVDSNRMI